MAYLALYRKWRPQTFDEVVGQKHISLPLSRAVTEDRLAHAYLFSGPRGTGKTSMAKILAKAVNCLHPAGANPCNECRNCREITSGASLDVYEIDAASNRGIEEIRALKESVQSLPTVAKKKIYIIDEVHMLTKEAFNALLKTLEEPPSHVLFILATTEPEKIPLTILSRCQRYEFRRISAEDIREHLLTISRKSGFSLSSDAAGLIAVRAEGGLRDALSLLDQCSGAAGNRELSAALVYDLLGLTGKDQILSLAGHILRSESGAALSAFSSILQAGKEPAAVLSDLLTHFRDVMIAKIDPAAPELTVYGDRQSDLLQEAKSLSEPFLDALFESLHASLSDTKRSASPRMNAEMGLLRLCRLRRDRTLEDIVSRLDALEQQIRQGIPAAPTVVLPKDTASRPPASHPDPKPAERALSDAPPAAMAAPVPQPTAPAMPPAPEPRPQPKVPASKAPAARPAAQKPPAASLPSPEGSAMSPTSYDALWKQVLAYFKDIHRIDIFMCFSKSRLVYAGSGRAVIAAPQPFIVQACNSERYQKITADAFKACCGQALTPRAVLMGSAEEAEACAQSQSEGLTAPAPHAPEPAGDGYEKIEKSQIPAKDLASPLLSAALKIAPDCDIYEKKSSE